MPDEEKDTTLWTLAAHGGDRLAKLEQLFKLKQEATRLLAELNMRYVYDAVVSKTGNTNYGWIDFDPNAATWAQPRIGRKSPALLEAPIKLEVERVRKVLVDGSQSVIDEDGVPNFVEFQVPVMQTLRLGPRRQRPASMGPFGYDDAMSGEEHDARLKEKEARQREFRKD